MVLGVAGTVLFALCGYVLTAHASRQDASESKIEQLNVKTTRLEVKVDGSDAFIREIRQDIKDIKERLERRP